MQPYPARLRRSALERHPVQSRVFLAEVRDEVDVGQARPRDRADPVFGFDVPVDCPGVERRLLNPRETWPDPVAYDAAVTDLAQKFHQNFNQFRALVKPEVANAGP